MCIQVRRILKIKWLLHHFFKENKEILNLIVNLTMVLIQTHKIKIIANNCKKHIHILVILIKKRLNKCKHLVLVLVTVQNNLTI
jgi:hypothetical protein